MVLVSEDIAHPGSTVDSEFFHFLAIKRTDRQTNSNPILIKFCFSKTLKNKRSQGTKLGDKVREEAIHTLIDFRHCEKKG